MTVLSLRWSQKVLRNALAYYKLKRVTLWGCGRSFVWETWATWVTPVISLPSNTLGLWGSLQEWGRGRGKPLPDFFVYHLYIIYVVLKE